MNYPLLFEDFAPDAAEVRESVINGAFSTQVGPDGGQYTGISTFPVPRWFDRISECLSKKIVPRISCFRLNLDGELPHSWVHSDEICAEFASVLYLNTPEQCSGGTAFWKHHYLKLEAMPKGQTPEFYKCMEKDWKNLKMWEQINFVPMKWNRFVTYPTSVFHSRFPFEAFGKGPQDGRLIWICFYDLESN